MESQTAKTMSSSLSAFAIIPRSTTSHTQLFKPMRVTMTSSAYKDSIDSDIYSHLKQVVTIRPPFEVFKPMHHLIFSTPKSSAPALCVAACEAVGGDRSDALSAAAALHLMHVATAVHENLLVGNVGTKLKYPFGPNIELLTGDGIVPLGFELLAMAGHNDDDEASYASRLVRVTVEITRAVGSQGVVDGQYRKYVSSEKNLGHAEQLMMLRKRSELHACGAACGAILGGGSEEKIEMLRRCGMFVGMMNGILLDGAGNGTIEENVMELKDLALKELEGMDAGEVEFISSIVDSMCGYLHSCVS